MPEKEISPRKNEIFNDPQVRRFLGGGRHQETKEGLIVPYSTYEKMLGESEEMEKSLKTRTEAADILYEQTQKMQNDILQMTDKEWLSKVYRYQPLMMPMMGFLRWLEKPFGIRFQTLKTFLDIYPIMRMLMNVRLNQMAKLGKRAVSEKDLGWKIRHKEDRDPSKKTKSRKDEKIIEAITEIVEMPHPVHCKSFAEYINMQVQNYLVFDRMATETFRTEAGNVTAFAPADGSTIMDIKLYVMKFYQAPESDKKSTNEEQRYEYDYKAFLKQYEDRGVTENTAYVQIAGHMNRFEPLRFFTEDEMSIYTSYPSVFLERYGFGMSLVEASLGICDSFTHAFAMNDNKMRGGVQIEGILGITGGLGDRALDKIKNELFAYFHDVEQKNRLAMIGLSQQGQLSFVPLSGTNKEMEMMKWTEFTACMICAFWQIHPILIFMPTWGTKEAVMWERSKREELEHSNPGFEKLAYSLEAQINRDIINKIHSNYELYFAGLKAEMTLQEEIDLREKDTTKSPNEKRNEQSLKNVSDTLKEWVAANPEFDKSVIQMLDLAANLPGANLTAILQAMSTASYYIKQQAMQAQQAKMQQMQGGAGGGGGVPGMEGGEGGEGGEGEEGLPEYLRPAMQQQAKKGSEKGGKEKEGEGKGKPMEKGLSGGKGEEKRITIYLKREKGDKAWAN